MRTWVQSLASLSWLRIWHCHELWCRLQARLRSGVAVAVMGSYSSYSTPSLGTSICCGSGPKKTKRKRKKKRERESLKLLVNNEMQTVINVSNRIAKITKSENTKCRQGCEQTPGNQPSCVAGGRETQNS